MMYSHKIRMLSCCAGLLCTMSLLWSVSANAAEIISRVHEKYTAVNDFTSPFKQTLFHKESGVTEARTGTLVFKKPSLIRWETTSSPKELIIVSDKEIWNYLPEEDVAYRYSLNLLQDSRNIIQVITGQARLDKDFDVKEEEGSETLAKLRLYPKEAQPHFVEAEVWIRKSDAIIEKAMIVDFYGNRNELVLESPSVNVGLASAPFRFEAPKGVDVEDRRNMNPQEAELFR